MDLIWPQKRIWREVGRLEQEGRGLAGREGGGLLTAQFTVEEYICQKTV